MKTKPAICAPGDRRRARRRMRAAALLGGASLLLTAVAGGAWLWSQRYLQGESFRRDMERLVADQLGVEGRFEPFRWSGATVECAGFEGNGRPGGPIARLRAEDIRLTVDLKALIRRQGEIRDAVVESLDLVWDPGGPGQGTLRGLQLTASRDEAHWRITARDGRLTQTPLPPITITEMRAAVSDSELAIDEALLVGPAESQATLRGAIQTIAEEPRVDLTATFEQVPLAPFLSSEWRHRITGAAAGNLAATGPLLRPETWLVSGQALVRDGRIRSLPMMDAIARFTGNQTFRDLPLHTAQAAFRAQGTVIDIHRIVAESEGTLRVEGAAAVHGPHLDGRLRVGMSSEALHWLPGARERVFNDPRDGYFWTPMHVAGPLDALEEDLTRRLVDAAREELFNRPEQVLERGIEAVGNWLRGVLD